MKGFLFLLAAFALLTPVFADNPGTPSAVSSAVVPPRCGIPVYVSFLQPGCYEFKEFQRGWTVAFAGVPFISNFASQADAFQAIQNDKVVELQALVDSGVPQTDPAVEAQVQDITAVKARAIALRPSSVKPVAVALVAAVAVAGAPVAAANDVDCVSKPKPVLCTPVSATAAKRVFANACDAARFDYTVCREFPVPKVSAS